MLFSYLSHNWIADSICSNRQPWYRACKSEDKNALAQSINHGQKIVIPYTIDFHGIFTPYSTCNTIFFALIKSFDMGHRKMEEEERYVCLATFLSLNMSYVQMELPSRAKSIIYNTTLMSRHPLRSSFSSHFLLHRCALKATFYSALQLLVKLWLWLG